MTRLSRLMMMFALLAASAFPLLAQQGITGDIARAEEAIRDAATAGAPVYAPSLYEEATSRLTAAKQNAENRSAEVRASARLDALEAQLAARAAEEKAQWIAAAKEANDLRDEIARFGGTPPTPPAVVEESNLVLNRGADSRERIEYARAVVAQAREMGAAAANAAALNQAEQYLDSAALITRSQSQSDTADYLAYQAEMNARQAMYEAQQQTVQGFLPGLRLERTRLAEVSKEREAAAERQRREQLEREAQQLRAQLAAEQQNRAMQAAELARLRQQAEEAQRRLQQQMMSDRQARIQAEQELRTLAQRYDEAIQGEIGSAEIARLRRQIEDQAAAIQAIQERERMSERSLGEQLQRMREELARERTAGIATPQELAAREAAINEMAAEYERLRNERQDAEIRLRRLSDETIARVAQNEARIREAEERARAAEAELQAQRERMEAMEKRLSELAETRRDERGLIVTLPGIFFDSGKSALKPGARETLGRIGAELKQNANLTLIVEGHTDSVGAEEMNQKLSEARANSVRDFLVEYGIDSSRIMTIGRGEASPVASNDSAAGRQQNRRVEVVIQQPR